MVHTTYRLTCDFCNKKEFNEGSESMIDLDNESFLVGWTRRKVPNGAVWDLCPVCSRLKTKELP